MCFIEFWRYNSVVQKIKNSFGDTLTCKRPKMLIKKMRHTIGARGFFGMHLLKGFVDFICYTSSSQEGVHFFCDYWLDCINTYWSISMSIGAEVSVCPLEQKISSCHYPAKSQIPWMEFLSLRFEAFWWKKVVFWSPSIIHKFLERWCHIVFSTSNHRFRAAHTSWISTLFWMG